MTVTPGAPKSRGEDPLTACISPALARLSSGDAEPVIVTDFLRVSSAPRLSTVLAGEARRHPVFAVDPVADLARCAAFVPLAELAAGYADTFAAAVPGAKKIVVVGYCAAAALALRIAARLAGSDAIGRLPGQKSTIGRAPGQESRVRVILVQPTWPDTAMIGADMAGFRADLGVSDGSPGDLDGDPGVILHRFEQTLRADMRAMARTNGLDGSAAVGKALADLLDRYRAWLGFLLASRGALKRPWDPGVPVDVLAGTSSPATVPWLGPESYAVTRLALPDGEHLATALLARSALDLVDTRPSAVAAGG
jgi:hypothetical protein